MPIKTQTCLKAKKSYGQHFLRHPEIARRIAQSLSNPGPFDTVAEIGPGKGMLTRFLFDLPYRLLAIEADRDMVDYLLLHYPHLEGGLISADFLKLNLREHLTGQFAIIGNFPYNISSQILFKMLEVKDLVPELVGMFQKEVAERVVAGPGTRDYGVISVLVQAFYEGEYLFTVDKENFIPPPKVQSGVIRLTRRDNQDLGCDQALFKQVVKQAFSQRRKMLRNTMKSLINDPDTLADPFFEQRPERLSVADFVALTNQIGRQN